MAAPLIIDCREPLTFSAGDTLAFERSLPDFLPSNGWSLEYQVRGGAAGSAAIQFNSTPDSTNTKHEINVVPATTAAWLNGDYVLVGYAVNTSGERHQIYYGEFVITPNLATGSDDTDVTTHAQRMIPLIEAALEKLAAHALLETDVERTRLLREKRMDLEKQLALNKEIRANEIALENVRNGRPSGYKVRPQFNVTPIGPTIGPIPPYPLPQ